MEDLCRQQRARSEDRLWSRRQDWGQDSDVGQTQVLLRRKASLGRQSPAAEGQQGQYGGSPLPTNPARGCQRRPQRAGLPEVCGTSSREGRHLLGGRRRGDYRDRLGQGAQQSPSRRERPRVVHSRAQSRRAGKQAEGVPQDEWLGPTRARLVSAGLAHGGATPAASFPI